MITSPPYPNEKDYTRTTWLESVLLGFVQNKVDIQALKKGLVRSNTRSVYIQDDDDQLIAGNEKVQAIAKAIEKRRIEMGKTSGFERMCRHRPVSDPHCDCHEGATSGRSRPSSLAGLG